MSTSALDYHLLGLISIVLFPACQLKFGYDAHIFYYSATIESSEPSGRRLSSGVDPKSVELKAAEGHVSMG